MPYFRVLLNGENFWLEMAEGPSRVGFFTTRYVEAQDEHEAEHKAISMVQLAPQLKDALNVPSNPPLIYCERITPLKAFTPEDVVQPGFMFYFIEPDA